MSCLTQKEVYVKKEEIVTIRIEDLTQDGLGIGRVEGMAVFVKDTVIGDLIRAKLIKLKKNYAYGRLLEILEASPDRVTPPCEAARPCGGCQLQMMSYEAQLRWKERKVRECLTRIGGFALSAGGIDFRPVKGMDTPWQYRNKAQFPIGTNREGRLAAGFYAGRTHSIIEQEQCLLGAPVNREILRILLSHMEKHQIAAYDEKTGTGLIRHCLIRCSAEALSEQTEKAVPGQIMICLITNGSRIPGEERLLKQLTAIPGVVSIVQNINTGRTNVILGENTRLLWGNPYIEDRIGSVTYRISARSFYQVNPVQTKTLYETALEFAGLTGQESVWDLYCGIGTISLFLARHARHVYGVEIVPEAIEDARKNAELNHLENTTFFTGKAEEVLPEWYRKNAKTADVIVTDPPRKGCEESVLETMVAMRPQRIVYVSCDPATLARDLKYLCAKGYDLKTVQPVDMFPQTVHVESCVLLKRVSNRKADSYVKLNVKMEDYYRNKDSKGGEADG